MVTTRTWLESTTGKAEITIDGDEEIRVVDDPAGTPVTGKVTVNALKDYFSTQVDTTYLTEAEAAAQYQAIDADLTTLIAGGSGARDFLELGTSNSPQFAAVNIGHATANTLTGSSGVLSVEGVPLGFEVGPYSGVSSLTIPAAVLVIRTNGYTTAGDGGGQTYVYVGSEPSHAGKVQDAAGRWFEILSNAASIKAFGAKVDNSTADTTAVQNAVNWSVATGKTILVPPGICRIGTVTIGAAGSYGTARFLGLGYYGHYTDANPTATDGSIFYLVSGTNGTMFEVASSNASDVGPAPPIFDNLWLYGNKSNQTGTSHGINCLDHTLTSNKQRAFFGNRLRISHFRNHGIRGGVNRNAGILNQFLVSDCGSSGSTTGHGIALSSVADWRTLNGDIGVCTGSALYVIDSATCIFTNTNAYSSNVGVTLTGSINNFVWLGGSIDRNDTDNVVLDGSGFVTSPVFLGAHFYNGSNAANDTDSDIKCIALAKDVLFNGCVFNNGSGNKPKHIVEFSGSHTGYAYLNGCTIESGAYITSLTNDATNLRMYPNESGLIEVKTGGTGASTGRGAAANIGSWYVLAKSGVADDYTGATAESVRATVTVPGGAMGPNGMLRITAFWSAGANNANGKTGRVRFTDTSGATIISCSLASLLSGQVQRMVWNRNSESSQVFFTSATTNSFATTTTAEATAAIDTSSDFNIVFTSALANSGDTLTLEGYLVEVSYGA